MARGPTPLTPGRKKLEKLGIKLPLLPVTSVGSLPKHQELKELRYKVAKGVQPEEELRRKERLSTDLWIREQERIGLQVLVDGQMTRDDLISSFARKISGFSDGGLVRVYGNRYYQKPVITGKLEWREPITVDTWRYAQRLTHKPVKAVVTGPYTLMHWSFNEYYKRPEDALKDCTAIIKQEISQLIENGAKIIQIDESGLSTRPDEFPLIQKSIKECTENQNSYFILHHAYGDLSPLWPKMLRLPVDNFDIEATNSNLAILATIKKHKTNKDISFGVIESHNHKIEALDLVRNRIRKALKIIPQNQLWLSPDSGLKTRTPEEASAKLRVLCQSAAKLRDKIL